MEHKTLSFEIKAVDYAGRTLEGYAAAFGNLDQVGDIIHPGAFTKTLAERGHKIKFLWQHDPTEPIGRLMEAREDNGGLYVKAIISDTARGRDALALLRDGAISEMSIGYDADKGGTDYSKNEKGSPVRNLRKIKLYEFSLVTFPANESAVVTALKGDDALRADGGYYPPADYAKILREAMESKPWRAVRRGDKWEVYKLDADGEPTGDSLGEHDSEDEAQAQVRALYANAEKDTKMDFVSDEQRRAVFANIADSGNDISDPWDTKFRDKYWELEPKKQKLSEFVATDLAKSDTESERSRAERIVKEHLDRMKQFDSLSEGQQAPYMRSKRPEVAYASRYSGIYEDAWRNYERAYSISHNNKFPFADGKSIKAGRTISRATLAELKAAYEVLGKLIGMGEMYDMPEEEESKSAPAGVPPTAVIEQTKEAEPDGHDQAAPPTSVKSLLLELDIYQAQLQQLEVQE